MKYTFRIAASFVLGSIVLTGCHLPGNTNGSGSSGAGSSGSGAVAARPAMSDTEFAKSTFTALAKGNQDVANDIDWENFQIGPQDVGAKYSAFKDEPNRTGFRVAFITSFSTSFHGSGGDETSLKNWTVTQESPTQSVISAENSRQTHMLLTISKKDGTQKLTSIQGGP